MKSKKREYKANPGATFPAKKAQEIGEAIESIGESITPADVVRKAKTDKRLNGLFEWDNKKAGDAWRIQQARGVLNHLSVVVVMPNGERKEMKAFYSQPVQTVAEDSQDDSEPVMERRYLSIAVIERQPTAARNVVEDARRELRDWKRRYEDVKDYFGPVFQAIEQVA